MESRLNARQEEPFQPAEDGAEFEDDSEEDSAPIGPSEDEEAAFLAGENDGRMAGMSVVPAPAEEEETTGGLPAMEELVKRIPAEVLSTMDELFRAKFDKVQRVPKKSLKK